MIEDSYDLVVSKLSRARQQALGWSCASVWAGASSQFVLEVAGDAGPPAGRQRVERVQQCDGADQLIQTRDPARAISRTHAATSPSSINT